MLGLEKKIIITSSIVLVFLVSLLAYSIFALGIRLPDCITDLSPFKKGEIIKKAEGFYEVHMVAKMWSFDPQEIRVPLGSTLDIFLSTNDVTHGFQLENTNVNLMAVPGTVNYARVKLTVPGVYHVVCHEYCGFGHQGMAAAILVGSESQLADLTPPTETGPAVEGKKLFTSKGCIACHDVNGQAGVGPSFKGLFGRTEKLSDGSQVIVDEAYIVESVKSPSAKVVNGFKPVMPVLTVSDEEMQQIISYIKTLK